MHVAVVPSSNGYHVPFSNDHLGSAELVSTAEEDNQPPHPGTTGRFPETGFPDFDMFPTDPLRWASTSDINPPLADTSLFPPASRTSNPTGTTIPTSIFRQRTQPPFPSWTQNAAEPSGWAHLPASSISHTSPYPEIPLLRIQGSQKRHRFGPEIHPSDPLLYVSLFPPTNVAELFPGQYLLRAVPPMLRDPTLGRPLRRHPQTDRRSIAPHPDAGYPAHPARDEARWDPAFVGVCGDDRR